MARHNEIGKIGENVAEMYLKRKGYSIIARNFRKPYGEIDIVAAHSGTTHFIEVKTVSRERTTAQSSGYQPEERVDSRKLHRLQRVVMAYVDEFSTTGDFQIDVVAVELDTRQRVARCRLTENVH